MGLFNIVLEGVLNEVRAEDAYSKFYSSMPREDFDRITGGEENIDKFIQFFLNCVRDGKSTVDEAVEAINAFKGADQLVKQKIKNKVSNGEYEEAAEVTYDVGYLSSGGAVLSRKKFAKDGYIKLGENERWLCTCTTNYCANNHYYGNSHWCTASDRMGRYDGFNYFRNYGPDCQCALIQFKWKGKVIPTPSDISVSSDRLMPSDEFFDRENGFIGEAIPEKYQMFQLQINEYLNIRQLCDWADCSMDERLLQKFVGEKMFGVVDEEKVKFCINKSKEQYDIETKYQESIYKLLQLKKEKKRKAYESKKSRLMDECEEYNRQKRIYIGGIWKEFLNEKLYENPDILMYMYNRDIKNTIDKNSDDVFKKTKYAKIIGNTKVKDGLYSFVIGPSKGMFKDVSEFHTDNGDVDCKIVEMPANTLALRQTIVIFVNIIDGGTRCIPNELGVFGPYDTKVYATIVEPFIPSSISSDRFVSIGYDMDSFIIDTANKNTFQIDFSPLIFCYGPNKFMFFDQDELRDFDFVIYDETTGKARHKTAEEPGAYLPYSGRYIVFNRDGWDYQIIGWNDESGNFIKSKIDTTELIDEIQTGRGGKQLRLRFRDDRYNLLDVGGELVFGFNGDNAWVEDGVCLLRYDDYDNPKYKNRRSPLVHRGYGIESILQRNIDGSYEKYDLDGPNSYQHEKCDKYGRTEKDLVGDRNLKAWQDAGGYSPEVKAQMDKMWADRKEPADSDGSEAMKAWNDNERGLDKRAPGVWGDRPFDFNNITDGMWDLTDFKDKKDDPNWGGYADLIDPTWAQRDETSPERKRGYFYRIGKQGQPLDQPWYSEDEVPANLSDRPVPHGQIYENYKSLISLMNRMGLLED